MMPVEWPLAHTIVATWEVLKLAIEAQQYNRSWIAFPWTQLPIKFALARLLARPSFEHHVPQVTSATQFLSG